MRLASQLKRVRADPGYLQAVLRVMRCRQGHRVRNALQRCTVLGPVMLSREPADRVCLALQDPVAVLFVILTREQRTKSESRLRSLASSHRPC